ncbi:hypothetical protein [Bradyrhizobium sp.]|jgi:hypothetical protein|uniref:hypothetical protein n=1 Tax=Bradyrhizobium sp. TaxID=376 RepID=UPI003BC8BD46
MSIPSRIIWAAMLWVLLRPACGFAAGIDTEHIYGFMIGSDVGDPGEREFQTTSTGRFSKQAGAYQALGQELELEFVPIKNLRIEIETTLAAYDIQSVPGLVDRTQAGWQGAALDLRYQFLDRETALFGLTLDFESHGNRIDETTASRVQNFGNELTVVLERDLIPRLAVATFNLGYQPEWTHFAGLPTAEQESTLTAAFGVMAQVRPDFLLGGEARYFRQYGGIGLNELAGEAFFVGPTAYFQLSDRARLTATWSFQAWGRPAGTSATLDLVNFERQQARVVFGLNF